MGKYGFLPSATLSALAIAPAAGAEVSNEELLRRIEEMQQKILVLERKLEIQDETAMAAKESTALVSAGPKGYALKSADGENQLKLRGTLHLDGKYIDGADPGGVNDGWQATRVRPYIEGTFAEIYDFKFMPDFGQGRTVIQDAYVTARYNPAFAVTLGKFKSPVGLERLQSASDIRFIQRAYPTSLVPNRDIGLQFGGDLASGRLSYQVALLNGSNDGSSSETFGDIDANSDPEYALRLFAQPFAESGNFALRGLGLGIAGTHTDQAGNATQPLLPSFRTPGQSTFFRYRAAGTTTAAAIADGRRRRLAPQLYYYLGSLGIMGEYTNVEQDVSRVVAAGVRADTIDTNAWQLQVSYFLTGEEETFRGFKPKTTFSLQDGSWGALELVGRIQALTIDDLAFAGGADSFADPAVSARKAESYGLGLNWYLNENLKWMLDYEHTRFDGGSPTGDRQYEDAVQLRMALGF